MGMNPRLLRPTASGFDPRRIANLHTWLDAADSTTVTLNSGNVSEWRDKSGNGRAFTQASAGAQPAYTLNGQAGKNCITFDGSRRLVSTAASTVWSFLHDGTTQYAMWAVCKATGSNQVRTILSTTDSAVNLRGLYFWHDFGQLVANEVRAALTNGGTTLALIHADRRLGSQTGDVMRAFQIAGDPGSATRADRLLLTNNAGETSTENSQATNAAAGAPRHTLTIGSLNNASQSLALVGAVCEIIIYERSSGLSSSERVAVMNYLIAKWGL